MIETILTIWTIIGYGVAAVYVAGVLLFAYLWLSEGHEWSEIIYLPLVLLWPIWLARRIRELRRTARYAHQAVARVQGRTGDGRFCCAEPGHSCCKGHR